MYFYAHEIELSDDMFIITREVAQAYQEAQQTARTVEPEPETSTTPAPGTGKINDAHSTYTVTGITSEATPSTAEPEPDTVTAPKHSRLTWSGQLPAQKWANFYMKVLTKSVYAPNSKVSYNMDKVFRELRNKTQQQRFFRGSGYS